MKIKFITTKSDFRRISEYGCRICHTNKFTYATIEHIYRCQECQTEYSIDNIGTINMLNDENTVLVKLYHKKSLPDEDSIHKDIHILKRKKVHN